MEAKKCGVNHLDADVLLPPRKRLLAGLKKQSTDGDNIPLLASFSPSTLSSPPSSSYPSSSDNFNTRLSSLLNYHSNTNLSPEGIVEVSRSAATAAVKAAEAARAAAEEKAAIAAKAVAAAKTALDLVASISEEAATHEKNLKKNKLKKHLPVQLLYKKYQPIENCKTDEELARKLHRAINSSPRILKNSPSNDSKGHKHKKPKTFPDLEKTRMSSGGIMLELTLPSVSNGQIKADGADSKSAEKEVQTLKADEKASICEHSGQSGMDNGVAETSQSKERFGEEFCATGKKRGRVKLKKLPLSICSFRDQATTKEETNIVTPTSTEKTMGKPSTCNGPLFSVDTPTDGVLPIEATSMWKCQDFKAPVCVKQNVMQS